MAKERAKLNEEHSTLCLSPQIADRCQKCAICQDANIVKKFYEYV